MFRSCSRASAICLLFCASLLPAQTVSYHNAYDFCRMLSSKEFSGRLTGDTGYTKAAQWVAGKFKSWGLKPYDMKNGYLQPFPAPYTNVHTATMAVNIPGSPRKELNPGKDFLPLFYTDSGTLNTGLVFAGWGISAPKLGYDDYAGLDVKGKVVLCFRGTPNREDSLFQYYDEHRTRMANALAKGALGLFYIYEKPIGNPNGDFLKGFFPAIISFAVANELLKEQGWTAAALEDSLSHSRTTRSFPLRSTVAYAVQADNHPDGTGYNVIGVIEGSDPVLKKECVILGAHLDHCGQHLGILFGGANDNASGSAAVMAAAEAMAAMKPAKRSIVFALFGGEETGLLGSKYLAEHPLPQFSSVSAMINFDMVGAGDGCWSGYSASPAWIKTTLDDANADVGTVRGSGAITHIGVRSSDFASFFAVGVPTITFGSTGPHLFYHENGDNIYRINPDMLADAARIGLACAEKIANR